MPNDPNELDLHKWLDGELPAEEAEGVERRLVQDEAVRSRLADYARNEDVLRAALAAQQPVEPSPAFDALASRLAARLDDRHRATRLRVLAPALAASIATFLAGVASYPVLAPLLPWRVPAIVETAARAHEILETTRAVEVPGTRRKELDAWVARHVGTPVTVPDLADVGFQLVGGRLLASDEGPLAQIVYEDGAGMRLTVHVSGAERVDAEEITLVKVDEFTAGYWQADDLAYSIVAETDEETLRQVAIEISAAAERPRS